MDKYFSKYSQISETNEVFRTHFLKVRGRVHFLFGDKSMHVGGLTNLLTEDMVVEFINFETKDCW